MNLKRIQRNLRGIREWVPGGILVDFYGETSREIIDGILKNVDTGIFRKILGETL